MNNPIAAKNVDRDALVRAIVEIQATTGLWASRRELEGAFPTVPPKVLLAKLRRLVKAGAIQGCACGCRGNFEVKG